MLTNPHSNALRIPTWLASLSCCLLAANMVRSQDLSPACPALFAPTNGAEVVISAPWALTGDYTASNNPSYLKLHLNSGPAIVPAGDYAAWCVDFADDITASATTYSAALHATCDPNLNQELGTGYPSSVYVSPAVWHQVDYLLNHKSRAYFWNVQLAIWSLVGGPVATNELSSPYPPSDFSQVNALLADVQSNSASWQPQSGDTRAIIVQIPRPAAPVQLVVLELPYSGPGGASISSSATDLKIVPDGPNVLLEWPVGIKAWNLQAASAATVPLVWKNIPTSPSIVNGQNIVTNPIVGQQQLYRLVQ